MRHLLWWTSAALAVVLDATCEDAFFYLALCTSGSWLSVALSALDWRHVSAFPWSNTWMLLFCVLGHGVFLQIGLRQLISRLFVMAAVMPLACMVAGVVALLLPLAWPPAFQVAIWCLVMLGTCAAVMHAVHTLPLRFSAARRVASRSSLVL